MSNAADLGTNTTGSTSAYQGFTTNYGATSLTGSSQGDVHIPYKGFDCTYGANNAQNIINSVGDQNYGGFISNYSAITGLTAQIPQLDNNVVYPHPKDQRIYYKLSGFNNNTSSYETWIIVEEIVPRPETFNPTGNPPSIDLNVFFAPPSGNKLSNIKIIARWIQ